MEEELIIKKEDHLSYKTGVLSGGKGDLVLTEKDLYILRKKNKKVFSVMLKDILNISLRRDSGGVSSMCIAYRDNKGKEKKIIFSLFSLFGHAGFFDSWEQAINKVRLGGREGDGQGNFGELEKLAELREKKIISEEEFNLKKKEMLGL